MFSREDLVRVRPVLYHLTSSENVANIASTRVLMSAATIFRRAGRLEIMATKRPSLLRIDLDGVAFVIRDQKPLHSGNVRYEGGWSFSDLVSSLNARVFFWPGDENGPISYGERHFERYRNENPAILRVPTRDLLSSNAAADLRVCRYNSGSPRCSRGLGSRRGPDVFVRPECAEFTPGATVEVTVIDSVCLPMSAEVCELNSGVWKLL